MEKFQLNILGCGSALPTTRHFPSSQIINLREKLYMIDCGEGAQLQLRKSKLKFTRLNTIFISHLHGDHVFGLLGLISTFGLVGRTAELHIYSPAGLQELFQPLLDFFCHQLPFKVVFHEFETKKSAVIYEDRSVTVTTIPLSHRIPCCGFLFAEAQRPRHLLRDMADFYHIPTSYFNIIKNGADYTLDDGTVVANERLTSPAKKARRYAYCSDTCYQPRIIKQIKDVDMLFHEATFAESDTARAQETFHSTTIQAATIARDAKVGELVIGHYSARYEDDNLLLSEAKKVFPNTLLAKENLCIDIKAKDQ
jgi:ribonuclease Z